MAENHDASARLAEGLPGVTDIERYVSACHALGYQHPDLTAHVAQVRDWYTSEDGMDLIALEADRAALQAVSAAVDEARGRQDAQRATLVAAWQGAGAQATRAFLAAHGTASAEIAAAVWASAQTLGDLTDRLWQAVDGKVATVLAVEGSAQPRRGDWLAAAQTVTTGTGDRAAASELVDQEVKPFVDNAVGGQWLSAMRATARAVQAAYDGANAELASQTIPAFPVPAMLGPAWTPAADGLESSAGLPSVAAPAEHGAVTAPLSVAAPNPSVVSPAGLVPSAAPAFPSLIPPGATAAAPVVPPPTDPAAAQGMAARPPPSLGGGGLPDLASGLSGFGRQLGDLFGGLFGEGELGPPESADPADLDDVDGLDDPDEGLDDPDEEPEEPGESDEEAEPAGEAGEENPEEPEDPAAGTCPAEPPPTLPVDEPAEEPAATPPPEPLATPAEPSAMPPEPLAPPPEPPTDPAGGTPCEIAADELPQVGE